VRALVHAELLKQRSTRTVAGLLAAMLGLVSAAVLLHSLALPAEELERIDLQRLVFGRGEFLATLFAALVGAMSITSEVRHGTIRATFLVSPKRERVVGAKVAVSIVVGASFGVAAGALAVGIGTVALGTRGIDVLLEGRGYALLVAGSAAAAALWAAIGVGVGAIVRNQVPTLVGICAWLLFFEGLLVGDASGLGDVGRFLPGAAAAAIGGQGPDGLLAPGAGLVLLAAYAAAATVVGMLATNRRDVA
jgi:ABC-type transport system involved in multi-copper enzyme maturation permease subunit